MEGNIVTDLVISTCTSWRWREGLLFCPSQAPNYFCCWGQVWALDDGTRSSCPLSKVPIFRLSLPGGSVNFRRNSSHCSERSWKTKPLNSYLLRTTLLEWKKKHQKMQKWDKTGFSLSPFLSQWDKDFMSVFRQKGWISFFINSCVSSTWRGQAYKNGGGRSCRNVHKWNHHLCTQETGRPNVSRADNENLVVPMSGSSWGIQDFDSCERV